LARGSGIYVIECPNKLQVKKIMRGLLINPLLQHRNEKKVNKIGMGWPGSGRIEVVLMASLASSMHTRDGRLCLPHQ
jgi:hypothetical protein